MLFIILRMGNGRARMCLKFPTCVHEASIHIWRKFSLSFTCSFGDINCFLHGLEQKYCSQRTLENYVRTHVFLFSMRLRMRRASIRSTSAESQYASAVRWQQADAVHIEQVQCACDGIGQVTWLCIHGTVVALYARVVFDITFRFFP